MRTVRTLVVVALALAALAGAGTGNSSPPIAASSTARTVLVVGDSLADQGAVALPAVLAAHGITATAVVDAAVPGTNLIDPVWIWSPSQYVDLVVDAHPEASTVVVEYIGTCYATCVGGLPYGGWLFSVIWQAQAQAIIDHVHSLGKRIVWTISPPVAPGVAWYPTGIETSVAAQIAWWDLVVAAPASGSAPIDWRTALVDTAGNYQTDLVYDGATHTVRTPDGLHLTPDGAARADAWSAAILGALG